MLKIDKITQTFKRLTLSSVAIVSNYIGSIIQIGVVILITNTFSEETYGEYKSYFSLITIIYLFIIAGKDSYLLFLAKQKKTHLLQKEYLWGIAQIIKNFLIIGFLSTLYLPFNDNLNLIGYLKIIPLALVWALFNFQTGILKTKGLSRLAFLQTNTYQRIIRIGYIVILIVITTNRSINILISSAIVPLIILTLWNTFKKHVNFKIEISSFFKKSYSQVVSNKASFQFSLVLIFFELINRIDVLLLSQYGNLKDVAYYDVSQLVGLFMYIPIVGFARAYEADYFNYNRKRYIKELRLIVILGIVITTFVSIFSDYISIIFGETYIQSSILIKISAIFILILTILGTPAEFLNLNKGIKIVNTVYVVICLILIILAKPIILNFGGLGLLVLMYTSLLTGKLALLFIAQKKGFEYNPILLIREK